MTCKGCSGAVDRALSKAEGEIRSDVHWRPLRYPDIETYNVDLDSQEVVVKGSASYDYVYEKIKKTGKEVRWSCPEAAYP